MGIFNWSSRKDSKVMVEDRQEDILQNNDNQMASEEITIPNNDNQLVSQQINKARDGKAINKEMTIGEVVRMYPDTVPIMLENGIHCFGCHVAHWETLEQGFRGHYGMDDEKLKAFIEQLNYVVENNIKTEMPK